MYLFLAIDLGIFCFEMLNKALFKKLYQFKSWSQLLFFYVKNKTKRKKSKIT